MSIVVVCLSLPTPSSLVAPSRSASDCDGARFKRYHEAAEEATGDYRLVPDWKTSESLEIPAHSTHMLARAQGAS
jgi:hypothetical protein